MEESEKREYEIAFYSREENAAPVKTAVGAHRGELVEEKPFEKVRFEFKIAKESFAFMGTLRVALPPEEIESLSRALSLAAGILRFLITVPPRLENEEQQKNPMESRRPAPPRIIPPVSAVLTNEEIEKKIEEILQ
ncbi:MAG: 30S ribosomal protein S6 [Candidatus Brennerbacteria bacterium]|nr:30S ribosomal protein S6 [Candidatus Brennerbacteria bacterium]